MTEVAGLHTVLLNLDRYAREKQTQIDSAASEIAKFLEAEAKTQHLWVTRTGALEASIGSTSRRLSEDVAEAIVYAGMDYAVFLELFHEGKWSWLWPAVESNLDTIRRIIERHLRA